MGPPFTNIFASCCTSRSFVFGAKFTILGMALGPMCHLMCWLLSCGLCCFAVLADRLQVILGEFPGRCMRCAHSAHTVQQFGQWLGMGSKWAHFTCLGTPNGLGSFLEIHIFDPFFTHFGLAPKQPIFKAFWDFRRAKAGHHELELAKNNCFGIPCGPGSFLKKVIFLHLVDLVDPFWHPPLWATSCSLPQPIGPRYRGLGVG